MKKEIRIFLNAVMFLTRIRVPKSIGHDPEYMQEAPRYFPVIGGIVGSISALFFLVFSRLVSQDLGIAASIIAGIIVTGAFHEDGFADVCDGFGGGWKKESILRIMKDSRIGAFGAIGLISILSCKFLLLKALPGSAPGLEYSAYRYFIAMVIAAHSASRLMAVFVMQRGEYASDPEQSKSKDITGRRLSWRGLAMAVVFALIPFLFLPWYFLLALIPAALVTWYFYRYFRRWIGGYTGDCLGAIQQMTEIVLYLGFVVVWRYF